MPPHPQVLTSLTSLALSIKEVHIRYLSWYIAALQVKFTIQAVIFHSRNTIQKEAAQI